MSAASLDTVDLEAVVGPRRSSRRQVGTPPSSSLPECTGLIPNGSKRRDAISTKRKTNKSDGPNRPSKQACKTETPIVHLPTFEDNTVFSLLSEDGLARGRNQLEQRLIAELGAPTLLAWHSFIENSLVPLLKKHATMKRKQWQDKYLKNVIPFMGLSTPDAESLCRQWMPAIQGFLDGHYQTVVQPTPAISRSCMEQLLTLSLLYGRQFEIKLAAIICWQDHHADWLASPNDYDLLGLVFDAGLVREWATCDCICTRLTSKSLPKSIERDQSPQHIIITQVLQPWAMDTENNLWKRRCACVTFVNMAPKSDLWLRDILTLMASALVKSPERFHQTAVGWLMRQVSVAHHDHVVAWIQKVGLESLSTEGLRYTTEKMPDRVAKKLMADYRNSRAKT